MKQVLKLAAAPASAMLALALLSVSAVSTPAAAGEFCRTDTSGMRGCGFDTMEQCEASSSGKGGAGCYRDPYLPEATNKPTNALAYQPKKNAAHPKKPAVIQ